MAEVFKPASELGYWDRTGTAARSGTGETSATSAAEGEAEEVEVEVWVGEEDVGVDGDDVRVASGCALAGDAAATARRKRTAASTETAPGPHCLRAMSRLVRRPCARKKGNEVDEARRFQFLSESALE